MSRPPPPPPPAGSADECEALFYEALRQGDLEALMALWAEEDEVACVHPGGMRLVGRAQIRASFAEIFAQGSIDCTPSEVQRVQLGAVVVHTLTEQIKVRTDEGSQVGQVQASNVYAQTPLGWRIVLHHASPGVVELGGGSAREAGATLH